MTIQDETPAATTTATTGPSITALRTQTCAMLENLDQAAKGRASLIRSCADLAGLSTSEQEVLRDLLRCITEQRKRLRALKRLWQGLDDYERPPAELVDTTQLCLRENRAMTAVLDPWRAASVGHVRATVVDTWGRLAAVANQFAPTIPSSTALDA
jgi:hypothetical protein